MDLTPTNIINLYREGRQDIEVCRELGITRKQFEKAYATNIEFRNVVDRGRDIAEAFWVEQARVNLADKDFNASLYKTAMQAHYGWADRVDNRNANMNMNLSQEEALARLSAALPGVMHLLPKDQQEKVRQLTKEVPGEYHEISE
jgi:hypothetical protein